MDYSKYHSWCKSNPWKLKHPFLTSHPLHPLPWCLYESCKTLARERSFFFPQSHAQSEKNNLSRLLSVSGHLTTKPSRPPTKAPRSIEFSLALFSLLYFHISKKCRLVVVKRFSQFFNLSNVKVYIHRTYTCITSICIIKSIRRSTQGSSIRIDRFVCGSTLN